MEPDTEQLQAELEELTRTERLLTNEVQALESYVSSAPSAAVTVVAKPEAKEKEPTREDHPDMAAGPPVAFPSVHAEPMQSVKTEILNPFASSETDSSLPPKPVSMETTGSSITISKPTLEVPGEKVQPPFPDNPFDSFRATISATESEAGHSNMETGSVSTATTHSVSTTASSIKTQGSGSPSSYAPSTTGSSTAITTDEVDVESVTTADFLRVPLAAARQRSGSEGDDPVVLQTSSLARGSMDDMALTTGALPTPRHGTQRVNNAAVSASRLGFDPNTYSFEGGNVVVTRFDSEPSHTPLPSFTEEESVTESTEAASTVATSTITHPKENIQPKTTAPHVQTEGLSVVASSIMSSYSLPANVSEDDGASTSPSQHLARKASSGAFSSDGDDDADEHTAAHMMKLMASRSIKPDLTLTDSQVYLTESEEADEAQALRSPQSDGSGGSSSASGTPRNQILSPFVDTASSDEGDYDHALDFFGDDEEGTSPRVVPSSTLAAIAPTTQPEVAVAAAAMSGAAIMSVQMSEATKSADKKPMLTDAAMSQPNRDVPLPTANATSSAKPYERSDPNGSKKVEVLNAIEPSRRRSGPTMKPRERACYLVLGVLFWVGIAFLMYCLVVWSRDGVGRTASLASPTEPSFTTVVTTVPTLAPSVQSNTNVTPTVTLSTARPTVATNASTSVPSLRGNSLTSVPVAEAPFDEELFQLLVNVSFDQGAALLNQSTPQFQAFEWLAGNANLSSYRETKRITRYVLATLYYGTGGNDTWLDDDLWLTDADECTWWSRSRVGPCGPTGRIQELELSYNNLQGPLPPELGLLDTLSSISIGGGPNNTLTGSIPSELGTLSLLQELRLPSNELTGSVPTAMGGVAMRTLQLNDNRLSGRLPSEIGSMVNLDVVSLQNNLLDGPLPTSIGQWSQLTTFNLAGNRVSLLPTHVGLMIDLVFLDLQDNQFQGSLVTELGQLQSLRILSLARNSLAGELVSELGLLSNLTSLDLSNNRLTGTIPSSLGMPNLSSPLRSLHLNGNLLEGSIPDSLVGLASLQTLEIQSNNFSGAMPSAICELYNETLPMVFIDCEEVDCPCCDFCCQDGLGCACRHLNTTNEWLCY